MQFPNFIGSAYTLRSVNLDCQRCVNLYPELNEAKTQKDGGTMALIGVPGKDLITTIGSGGFRGQWTGTNGLLYAVIGNTAYQINSDFSSVVLGTLSTSSGPVDIKDNSVHLVIVDGPNMYYMSLPSIPATSPAFAAFTKTTDPNWKGSNLVLVSDQTFVFAIPNGNEFYMAYPVGSTLGQSYVINPISFLATNSLHNIISMAWYKRTLWIICDTVIEQWYDSGSGPNGTTGNPFQLIQGGFIQVGGLSPFSARMMGDRLHWLGQDENGQGIVFRNNGLQAERVSTHAIDLAIQSYGDLSGTTSWAYQEEGHNFLAFNFLNGITTWVFDSSTGMWHERQALLNGVFQRDIAQTHSFAYGKNVVGDYQSGNLYLLDSSNYDDAGNALVAIRSSPHVSDDMKRVFHHKFQIDFEPGIGKSTGQGEFPQVMMKFSDDGGHTYSNELWRTLGPQGIYKARAIWRKLGQSRTRVYQIMISDPVKRILIGATLDVEGAAS